MQIGIVGYGAYVPKFRIGVDEIARVWKADSKTIRSGLLVDEKSVPDKDEDTITISVEAGRNALLRAGINPQDVGAVYIGSESHPYAVKPSGTVVADALNMGPELMVADFEFACKAGTAAIQCCYALVKSGEIKYGMAIGADCAQSKPGDALEYTAAAGGAAYIIGKNPLATLEGTYSYTTDTSDFWRREGSGYPSHGARFTGKPAYFKHVISATNELLSKLSMKPSDFNHAVFHMPNGKFPLKAAKSLGFSKEQLKHGMVVTKIGNCYSGSSLLGLSRILDNAKPGEKILMTSYGSGAGSDSFSFVVTDKILERANLAKKTDFYIKRKETIDYGTYVRLRKKLKGG
ncbi:MAG: hydroxymethylglutaryl-CoA synthase [Candidatus Aenigmarchaeota archaeon]|nr:hydroxymethylglutaryl-CoA synthase [Candidatus Aenigmarchaeota archaeon]NIP39979.1 hydroxymethylglutaryl-CoA synthase [Candidatus Aenigmarchaeota archaeon]NIQ17698.1 hydroxymethylglutaryl-CoA synthase [Candidatus Aenigmarchaeota archaeon]NIS72886.1 hydroxymethylglutaryl-CoA synthase [Candidatus Aenigmarchaeota archaeon]